MDLGPNDRFVVREGQQEITWYRSSEHIEWGFCKSCGSSLLYRAVAEGHPESPGLDRMYVSAACLDHLDRAPRCHVSYEEHTALLEGFAAIPKYRGKTDEEMEE